MSDWTPGPWEVGGRDQFVISASLPRTAIAMVYKYEMPYEANARLIAAAPELVDALKDAQQFMERFRDYALSKPEFFFVYSKAFDKATAWAAVIAKVEGQASA